MIPNKGLYLDTNKINQPPGTWSGARNILVNQKKQAITNEGGADITATNFPFTLAKPIGTTMFPNGSYLLYAMGTSGPDRIGVVDEFEQYTDLIVDNAFNFNSLYPIRSSEFDFNAFGERIVAFTDRFNNPRIINIDNLPFALNPDKSLVNPSDISDIEMFTKMVAPNITYTISQNGGSLKTGAYSFAIAYENNDGTRTPNSPLVHSVYITDDGTSVGFDQFDGALPNTLTAKAIALTINNVDTRYDKLVLIIVKRNNGITTAVEIKKLDIGGTTLSTTYTGTELETPLTLEEVLTPRPLYNKVGCMTQINSQLFIGDLEAEEDIEYQSYANLIRIYYNTRLIAVQDINNSNKNGIPPGFAHGGVYAFYIAFVLKNGSWSRAFHIPGRGITGAELSFPGLLPTDPSPLAVNAGLAAGTKRYQIEDTTNRASSSYILDGDTNITTSMAGTSNMGYWENQDEVYPANFPNGLAGQKVRHHVFPTIHKCKEIHYGGSAGYGREQLDILGIDVANVTIPPSIQDKIEGWAIFYAQRDYINSNTLGNDLWLTSHKSDDDASMIWSAGGNWRGKSFDASGTWEADFVPNPNYIRGHNFELLKDKPSLAASGLFLEFDLRYRKNNLNARFLDVGKIGGNLADSGEDEGQNAGAVIDLTDSVNTSVSLPPTQLLKAIQEFKYYPNNIIDGNIRTIKNEETIHIKVFNGDTIPFVASEVHANSQGRGGGNFIQTVPSDFTNGGEDSYLLTYKQLKTNLFTEFTNQILVLTEEIISKSTFEKRKLNGGDTFLNIRSFICSSPRHPKDFESTNGTAVIRAHIAESRYNIGLRYEVVGDPTTRYYPKTPAQNFWTNPSDPDENGVTMIFDRSQNPNNVGYSNDYNQLNIYNQLVIFNTNQRLTNKFPYRVLRGGIADTSQNSINGWRTFLAANFYESNRNRGRIINLVNLKDTLIIHHQYGLFRTIGTQKLQLETTEVFLGSGDIFSQQPREPVTTKLGFLGNQNIFASITFKGNYCWCDQSQGRIFMLNDSGVTELSNDGTYNYFRDNLLIDKSFPDSPIEEQGLIMGYDPKYDRLLLTKKANSNPWTLSFSLEKEQGYWVCNHDFIPDYTFYSSNNIFAFKGNKIYKLNSNTRKAKYFDETIYPSQIGIVFNQNADQNKQFFNVAWISEIFDSNNILQRNKTLSHIRAITSYQDSGEIVLKPHQSFTDKGNTRKIANSWYFNKFKDQGNTPYKRKNMADNWCEVTFKYDNAPNLDSSQNSLYLYLSTINANIMEL